MYIYILPLTRYKQPEASVDLVLLTPPIISSKEEITNSCKLGLDTWADIGCSGKHTYVKEFLIETKSQP